MTQYETELCYCGETSVNKITSIKCHLYLLCSQGPKVLLTVEFLLECLFTLVSDLGSEAVQQSLRIKILIPKVCAFVTASSFLHQMAVV